MMTIEQFIGRKARYDYNGQMILGIDLEGNEYLLLDVRGWGRIHTNSGISEPEKFQDDLGEWIADAINQKLSAPKKDHK